MKLLVQYEQKSLDEMDAEIQALLDSASKLVSSGKMEETMKQIDTNLQKLEENITALKWRKFQRDVQDYIKGEVYTWSANKPNLYWNPKKVGTTKKEATLTLELGFQASTPQLKHVSSDDQSDATSRSG